MRSQSRSALPEPSIVCQKRLPGAAASLGAEHHATSVWRPDRRLIGARIGRQPIERSAGKVPEPDIVLLIADFERHAGPIR